jgi:hypothetical protein
MAKYSLPYFGELDTDNLEEYYRVNVDFNGEKISIDLNFGSSKIDIERFDLIKRFLENIGSFDKNNKEYIKKDYEDEDGNTVKSYVSFHLEDIEDEDELSGIVDFTSDSVDPETQLVNALKLVRLGLYPDGNEDQFAIFDYSLGRDITNYLVVLFTDENGNFDYMTMES